MSGSSVVARVSRHLVVALAVEAALLAVIAVVVLDLYAHKQVEAQAGLNIWGYRGAVVHRRHPGDIRIEIIGGTRAFALGMPASWTVATVLRQQVMLVTDRRGGAIRPVVPIMLARPGALPDSYPETVDRFAYLQPDYICLYDDLGVGGALLPEETSGVFARIGYWPALPLVLREKGMAWRFGSVRLGYRPGERTVSAAQRPWTSRAAGALLERAGEGLSALDGAMTHARPRRSGTGDPDVYANQMLQAVDAALQHARGVVVVVSPAESAAQSANLAALLPRMKRRLAATRQLRFVDLAGVPALTDTSQRLDDWNYGGDGIMAEAVAITPAVLELIGQQAQDDAGRR